MIRIYEKNETNFSHNGLGILKDCIRAEVKRDLNGSFTLELEYPLNGMFSEIQQRRIIKAPTPSGDQLFRIQQIERDLNSVYVYAPHIVYDLADNFIVDTNIVDKTRLEAVQQILANTMNAHSFTASGGTTVAQNNLRIVRYNPVRALLGSDENTIIRRYGGEFDFDNFNITVKDEIGVDTSEVISYGKNLTGITETLDMSSVATRIIPQGSDELLLPEYYIDSPNVGAYDQVFVRHMEFDIGVDDNTTEAQALDMIRDVVNRLYTETHIDQPFFNYEVEFVNLGDTEEYNDFQALVNLKLGDKVTIKHSDMNVNLKGKIIAYEYDSLLKRYIKIQLGSLKKDITLTIEQTVAEVEFTKQKIEMAVKAVDERVSAELTIMEGQIAGKVSDSDFASLIEQNASSVKVAVGEIGVNNLVKDGSFETGFNTKAENYASTLPNVVSSPAFGFLKPYEGEKFLYASGVPINPYPYVTLNQNLPLKPGDTYTASYYFQCDTTSGFSTININLNMVIYYDENDNYISEQRFYGDRSGQLCVNTFTVPDNPNIKNVYFRFGMTIPQAEYCWFVVDVFKIEEGENATAWSPHPSELKGANYTFDSESFKIGNGTTIAEHAPEYSKWTHSDGSYTKAGIDGLERYIGASGNKYASLVYANQHSEVFSTSGVQRPVITLPDEFKGKDFKAVVVVNQIILTTGSNSDPFLQYFRASLNNLDSNQIDRVNGTITPYISLYAKNRLNSWAAMGGTVIFSYIIIA